MPICGVAPLWFSLAGVGGLNGDIIHFRNFTPKHLMIQRVCGVPSTIGTDFKGLAHLCPNVCKGGVNLFVPFAFVELPKAVILFLELC